MGGRGSSSQLKISDRIDIISKQISALQKEKENLSQRIEQSYKKHVSEHGSASKPPQEYYDLLKRKAKVRSEITKRMNERSKIRESLPKPPAPTKKFVNGYGEATKREITSLSYKRWQRRLDKEIDSHFKGR